MPSSRHPLSCLLVVSCLVLSGSATAEEALYLARPLTEPWAFTEGIEGPACDALGNVYAVNFARQGTIGRVGLDGKAEVYVTLPEGSIGNGLRYDPRGSRFFVADYTGHNILSVDTRGRRIGVFAHEPAMNQPNDLAMASDGTLYASDPSWAQGTGQLWRIDTDGKVTRLASGLGTTNGIELSPDGKTLHVNESVQLGLWAFPVQEDGTLGERRLMAQFPDHGFDGMRADVDGNLYITRHGKGVVAIVSPEGKVLREVDVLGKKPSNLCFGGPDGRTVYVTEVEHRRLVQFRVERPGLEWWRSYHEPSALQNNASGWLDLMPAADLRGWRRVVLPGDPASAQNPWSLVGPDPFLRASGKSIKEMLLHEVERGDGIFHVEWRFIGGKKNEYNGGVYVRTDLHGGPWVQAQLAEPRRPRVGDLFSDVPGGEKPKRVEVLSAYPDRASPPGEWNELEVTCRGGAITLWVNGAVTAEWQDCPLRRGHVGLQAEFFDLEFRQLKYLPLGE